MYKRTFKPYQKPMIVHKPLNFAVEFSEEQKAIFAWFAGKLLTAFTALVVVARAGVGKTFTAFCAILNHAMESKILYLVFNKKNEIEAQTKCNDVRVTIKTCHAMGLELLKRHWGKLQADSYAEWNRIQQVCPELSEKKYLIAILAAFIDSAKNVFLDVPTLEELTKFTTVKELEANDKDSTVWPTSRLVEIALRVITLSKERAYQISFTDMIWLPVALGIIRPEFPLVVIDEAQDLNPVQLELVARIASKRVCFIGDDRQAIYTWRGAMPDSLEKIVARFNATTLKLSQTYRCGKAIVTEAQGYVPDYNAHENNATGEVLNATPDEMLERAEIGNAILSRVNAPLMKHALALVRKGVTAKIEGKDIEKELLQIIERLECSDITFFSDKLESWASAMIAKATGRNADAKIELITDQKETLQALCDVSSSIEDMQSRIKSLFQNSDSGYAKPAVVLSTVHRAKGLEWDTVYMLKETFERKRRGGFTELQLQEEQNIKYVAITRAKSKLVYVR